MICPRSSDKSTSRTDGGMIVSRWKSLGEFEHLLLLAVMRLGEDAYGVTIRREIEERTGRPVLFGCHLPDHGSS